MKIYFFYPSNIIGGVEVLFARLSTTLAERGFDVCVFNLPTGIYSKLLNDCRIKIIELDSDVKFEIEDLDIIITPPSDLTLLSKYVNFSIHSRILFWFLQPYNLVQFFPKILLSHQYSNKYLLKDINKLFFYGYHKNVSKFLIYSSINRGLIFMDSNVLEFNEFFYDVKFDNPSFVKIPVIVDSVKLISQDLGDQDEINLAWIGRIKDDALPILHRLITDLELYGFNHFSNINFHVVGEGNRLSDLIHFTKKIKNIKFVFLGTLPPEKLNSFLSSEVNCLFAFGTSALEGAKLGIPVCLLDPSYKELKNGEYFYKWLFDSINFKLGRLVNHYKNLPEENNKTISNLLKELKYSTVELSEKTFEYVNRNHNIIQTELDLIKSINDCGLKYSEIQHLLVEPLIRKIINFFKIKK